MFVAVVAETSPKRRGNERNARSAAGHVFLVSLEQFPFSNLWQWPPEADRKLLMQEEEEEENEDVSTKTTRLVSECSEEKRRKLCTQNISFN